MKYAGILHDAQQGYQVLLRAWEFAKPLLLAGHKLSIKIGPVTRSGEQNAKFHAMVSDIAKSGLKWAGKPRSEAQWKVLMVSGHAMATNEGADIVPGLENEFVNLRESTALMSKARGSSLIEYTAAFMASHGIEESA